MNSTPSILSVFHANLGMPSQFNLTQLLSLTWHTGRFIENQKLWMIITGAREATGASTPRRVY